MADQKNPLVSGSGGSSSGGGIDFVKDADQLRKNAKGADFVDQDRKQPTCTVQDRANPDSIPEGGALAPVALNAKTAPGNGGSTKLTDGGSGSKPFKLK